VLEITGFSGCVHTDEHPHMDTYSDAYTYIEKVNTINDTNTY